jgi:hypothetical protein
VLDQFRYVGVSAGNLRFVDTYRRGGAPNKVAVWTLPHPYATEWMLEHEATFADIWADDTYKATGLPKKPPVFALIHPHNPAVVYFFLEDHLFAVDVPRPQGRRVRPLPPGGATARLRHRQPIRPRVGAASCSLLRYMPCLASCPHLTISAHSHLWLCCLLVVV